MTTASKLINDALVLLQVASVINPPEPEHEEYGFDVLKNMINEWIADGIDTWAALPNDITDEVGESPELTETIKALLAKRLSAYIPSTITPQLNRLIQQAEDRILDKMQIDDPIWPDNLPMGAGNSGPNRRVFFPGKVCDDA